MFKTNLLTLQISLILLITFKFNVPINGQTKTETLDLGQDSKIYNITNIAGSGFVVYSGHTQKYGFVTDLKSRNRKITYYDNHLNRVWQYLPGEDDFEEHFVSSLETDWIYWMTYDDGFENRHVHAAGPIKEKRISYIRFNDKGIGEKMEHIITESSKNFGLMATCMDATYFYVLSKKIPDADHPTRAIEDQQIMMYRIGHNEKDLKKFKVDIDLTKGGAIAFLGIEDGELYFSQQRIESENKLKITIYKTNSMGELISSFQINPTIKGYYYPRHYERNLEGPYATSSDIINTRSVNLYTENSYGEVKLDLENEELYFFSYSTDEKDCFSYLCPKLKAKSLLFNSYKLDGEFINSYQVSIEKHFKDEKIIKNDPFIRDENLYAFPNVLYRFDSTQLKLNFGSYLFLLNNNGIIKSAYSGTTYGYPPENIMNVNNECFTNLKSAPGFSPLSYVEYLKTISQKNKIKNHFAIRIGSGYVLVKYDNKTDQLEMKLFE